jgi:hypothetical protein
VAVRDLLALTARCPKCNASLRDIGLSMRHAMDDNAAFFDAVRIIMYLEEDLGITITDESVEAIRVWNLHCKIW